MKTVPVDGAAGALRHALALQPLLDGLPDGVAIRSAEGRVVYANPAALRALGVPSLDALAADAPPEIAAQWDLFDEQGLVRLRARADGEERWVRVRASPLPDAEGRPAGAALLLRDVTEERRREEGQALPARAPDPARLEEAADALGGFPWEAEADTGRFTFVGRRAETVLGHPVRRWLEEPGFWAAHVHPQDRARAVAFRAGPAAEAGERAIEYRMIAADGRVVWIRDALLAAGDAQGGPARRRGLMVDVTLQKRTESRLAAQSALTGHLADARDVADAAEGVLAAIGRHLGWELGAFWRVAEGRLACVATWRAEGVRAEAFEAATRARAFAPGEGLPGRAWQEGRPVWLDDFAADASLPRVAHARAEGLHAALGIPIPGAEGTQGVLEFFSREARAPDEELLAFAAGLGLQVGQFMERLAAEAALRESNARRGAVLASSLDGVVTIDARGRVTEWNPAAERAFGWSREEALGREMADLVVPPEMREAHRKGLARLLAGGESRILGRRMEVPAVRRDGSTFPVELAIARIPASGEPAFTGFLRDITDRKRAEDALRFQKTLLAAQMEAVLDGIVVVDNERRVVAHNRQLRRVWGLPDALMERPDTEALLAAMRERAEDPEAFEAGILRLRRDPSTPVRDEVALKDGRTLERYGAAVCDPDGVQHGRVWTFRDITERKRADETLRRLVRELEAQRTRLDAIVGSVPGVVWEAWGSPDEKSQRIDYVSDHVERMLGYTTAEWLSKPNFWLSIVHPEDRERAARESAAIFLSGKAGEVRFRWVAKDGSVLWVQAHAVAVLDAGGRPVGMRGVTLDVTERKRAEEALRESEARYRFLAENTRDLISRHTPEGVYLYASPAARAILGYDPEEMIGRSGHEWVHPEDAEAARRDHDALLADSDACTLTMRYRRKDGRYVWLETIAQAVRDPATGRVAEIVASSRDVTERKEAEEALQERAEELARLTEELRYQRDLTKTITDNAASALFMMDKEGHPVFMNPAACAMTGYAGVDEIEGRPLHDAIHFRKPDGSRYPIEECPIDQANAAIVPLKDQREVFCRKDGTLFPVEYNLAPVERGGAALGAVIEVRDIAEKLRAEKALQDRAEDLARLAEALERSNRELDQFAYVASHDLKAPLRGIANLSRWIEEDLADRVTPETRQHLELLRGRVARMEALIDAILEYSRVGRRKGEVGPVDVRVVLAEVVDLLSPPPGFSLQAPDDLPVVVTERARLQQVLLNLVGNAIKHHPEKQRCVVSVGVEDLGERWRFSVADNGRGIPRRFHDRVFAIFQTLEARDKVEGAGIGLAIVKKVVESKGGHVELDSDEGRGATFRFTWPKQETGGD